ncbi:hypothetical protein RND71_018856 [Anisodus tanguticus]|uniref:Glutaredoxin domain-containing protein n=1 Tax=Anisodus tanguticus TaxID=243964 RepID=A0AAE1S501_9SOLA|nr:hypothetical protein RND71_018856 [Anisodus tanguticus]
MDKVQRMASDHGVVIFSKSTCCLCYSVTILFRDLGVDPYVHELDHDSEGKDMEKALMRMGCNASVPAVFIGGKLPYIFIDGKLVGSTNEVMSLHLKCSLNTPLLKPYLPD